MKKIALCFLMAACLSFAFYPLQSNASPVAASSSVVTPKLSESQQAKALMIRLNEINKMDKSNLMPVDRIKLRKEVLSIKQQLKEMGGVIYISLGAAIIIVLLLIILL